MQRQQRQADLFLEGKDVGHIDVQGSTLAWGFGKFTPYPDFSGFALRFGYWSLLMHEDYQSPHIDKLVLDELRDAEEQLDRLHAELLWLDTGQRTPVRQINIDGPLIEWHR